MDGDAAMDSMISRVRKLGRTFAIETAKEAAPAVERAARETAAAGTTPEGQAWRATKDGRRPLVNAAASVFVKVVGAVLQVVVRGHHVFHHLGAGNPKRQVIPDANDSMPPAIKRALEEASKRTFRRTMGGG